MSRRQFVGCAAGVVSGLASPPSALETSPRWGVLDLGRNCSLRESLVGYESTLGDGVGLPRALIVPAAVQIPPAAIRTMARCQQAGGTVLLESGAGFATEQEFRLHRATLRDYLHVRVETPVSLWPRRTPYVDYTWPHRATLRDFSRVVPLGCQPAEVIARVDGLPVALTRRWGAGRLIVLGSPLGPALWAGDPDARRLLLELLGQRR